MSYRHSLRNDRTGEIILARVKLCKSFWCKFRGLQLAPPLPDDQALLFVYNAESRSATTIHMFFMRFNIAVVWLDRTYTVVDKQYAKIWRPAYAPRHPAQYFIEANPTLLDRLQIGDHLALIEASS